MRRVKPEYYDLNRVAIGDKGGRWEQILSTTHVATTVRLDSGRPAREFRASARRVWIDDLALVDAQCDPCSGSRSWAQVQSSPIDYVVVLINRGGREAVTQGGASTTMRAGDVVVWDSTLPFSFHVAEPLSKRSLFIPRATLRDFAAREVDVADAVFDSTSPATELLTSYLDVLGRTIDKLPPAAVASARDATLNLVAAALEPEQSQQLPRRAAPGSTALRHTIEQWIEENLAQVDLSPSTIAIQHHLSVRTVHRIFERSGDSVGSFIRARRLARARQELANTDDPITDIAARWQFYDSSHFTRAFRAQYGISPSEYRFAPARAS